MTGSCLSAILSKHLTLMSQVLCHLFGAVALSLAAKQPYDMVAAFLLQNHCPLPPPQSRGLSQHDLSSIEKNAAPSLKVSLLIMESTVGAVLWSYCISRN